MANTYNWTGLSGLWSIPANWKTTPLGLNSYPGEVGANDAVAISSAGTISIPVIVTYDPSAATIGSLTISGTYDTLALSGWGNALTIDLTGSVYQGLLAGSNNTLALSGTNQTLTIDLGGSYTQYLITGSGDLLSVGANTLKVANSVSGSLYITAGSLTLAGGSFDALGATLRLQQGAAISGYGSVSADKITYAGSYGGAITASGGVLHVSVNTAASAGNIVNNQIRLGIDDVAGGDLTISGAARQGNALALDNSNQTLEIASDGSLEITALQSLTNATILLDGGNALFKDTYGVNLDTGSHLSGAGTVSVGSGTGVTSPTTAFNGAGTVTAKFVNTSSYTLTFVGGVDQTGSATSFIIDSGATLAFQGEVGTSAAGGISPTISFQTGGSVIAKLDLSAAPYIGFYGVVQNFYNYAFGSDQILVGGSATGNTLFVTDAGGTVYTGGDTSAFTYVSVYNGAALVDRINLGSYVSAVSVGFLGTGQQTTLVTTEVICFMAGTMIRTPDGEVAVETLSRGDLVLTAEGLARPVSWLGRQTVSTRFADPLRVLPIRIKAGALAENIPCRDLLLSPDHAVLVDGALIQAGALVNDASILRETAVPEIFAYYHVELDDHSLVLAENTPAETFVDNVERLAFDNWAEHEALYPEGKSITELPYPRAKGRRQVPVYVRVLLAERAEIIGASTPAVMVA